MKALSLVIVIGVMGGSAVARAEDLGEQEVLYSCGKPKGKVRVSFKDEVAIGELVSWAMGFTCKNFTYSSTLGSRASKVVFVTPSEMTASQAWQTFLVALRSMRLTLVTKGDVIEVVEAPQAKRHGLKVVDPHDVESGEQYVRALFRAEHVPVAELSAALAALKSEDGELTSLAESAIVMVSDYGSHVRRMATIAREIDRPRTDEQVFVIRVRHGDVAQIASSLEAILGTAPPAPSGGKGETTPIAGSSAPTRLLTDERTRSIVVVGSEAAYERASALARQLDVELDEPDAGHVHLYLLQHADAEALSLTLQSLVSNRPAPASSKPARPTAAAASPADGPVLEGDVRVTFDKPSNALLVMASMADYLALREVIRRLDNRRPQVLIEAMILDISIEGDRVLRGAFHGGDVRDGTLWLTGLGYDDLKTTELSSAIGLDGLLGGLIGAPLPAAEQLLGKSIPSFAVLFQALATSRNANILSAPRVMTVDNAQAVISVGQRVPTLGAITSLGTGSNVSQSIERTDVALTLKVTPHVASLDEVRLDIDLVIENIIDIDPALGPTTSKRTVTNTVIVGDAESIVIGGLISDEEIHNEQKVPLLGDIPVLGHLFKRERREKRKRNLLILLTPHVIADRSASDAVLRETLRQRAEFARAFASLDTADYEPRVDYRRKRGLVEEINRAVQRTEEEAKLLDTVERERELPAGRIWPLP